MACKLRRVVFILAILSMLSAAYSEDDNVINSLTDFMAKLSDGNPQRNMSWGWNTSSDPCTDAWLGVTCDSKNISVRKIILNDLNFAGTLAFDSVCEAKSLAVLSLEGNHIAGGLTETVSTCKYLTHMYLNGNRLTGKLPDSLSKLSNLKRLDISSNRFSGELPNLPKISGLLSFLAQDNQLTGLIPTFDFNNLVQFNVSNNNFSGPVPDLGTHFNRSSLLGNPELCGKPLLKTCSDRKSSNVVSAKQYLIYSGYIIIGLCVIILFVSYKCFHKCRSSEKNAEFSSRNSISVTSESKGSNYRSEYSITSLESGMATKTSSLIVLTSDTSPVAKGLKFEELLRAPAELLGRGKHGSTYKVTVSSGTNLAVKRFKDLNISHDVFKKRMETIDKASHRNVLPLIAFYCSKQEKLLVYEYHSNGSLFNHLHGNKNGKQFEWGSRLNAAVCVAEAVAYMHERFNSDPIPHGNLKSTNIILNKDMEPCISEYGLMMVSSNNNDQHYTFKEDVYSFGVILLELLTGKPVGNNGFDLARWVESVVREEWTGEVFDRGLVHEGASEERMVNLLQIALKCTDLNPHLRPGMNKVGSMLRALKVEDERSIEASQVTCSEN